ncbi:MAG: DUF2442 domain-containing protein [Deltaproteobacteria bacterium]|nr:DUF2442 domain-containing protein [Deltaproteobacteria bacterium]
MDYRLIDAKYVRDFVVWVKFSDGVEGEVDLREELSGPVFEPLRNVDLFKKFIIHPELQTLVWENDADFSPEFLHDKAQQAHPAQRLSGH